MIALPELFSPFPSRINPHAALASGQVEAEPSLVGAWAADAVAEAIRRAVLLAVGAGGIPAVPELG